MHIRKYFELAHPLEDLDELQACSLTGNNYHLIFAIPQAIVNELSKSWPGLRFSHQLIPFGHACAQDQSNNTHTAVYVQAYSSFADIMVFQEGRMKLANAYMIQEKNDLIYHLLNTYRHLGLNAAYDELIFADRYIRGLQRPESLKKYFKNVRFFKPGISDANLSLFQAQDISRYVNLLNLRSCAL